jgi:hypothetical protein
MKKTTLMVGPALMLCAAGAIALPATASAASGDSYQATLAPLNHSTGSGTFMLTLNGNRATVTEKVSGLADTFSGKPYPHVQHIHIMGQGQCPTLSADKNGDGVISTVEGHPAYGMIGTTLSTSGDTSPKAATDLKVAAMGGSYTYQRTFTLNPDTMKSIRAGNAVVVVHGLDPATLSKKAQGEKSELVPSLPLAATSPALCGAVKPAQMAQVPVGAAQTGAGDPSGLADGGLLLLGGGLLLTAGTAVVARRKVSHQN